MKLVHYFTPQIIPVQPAFQIRPDESLQSQVEFMDPSQSYDWSAFDVAVIGIEDGRNDSGNAGTTHAPNEIRKKLYPLRALSRKIKIVDLGNLKGRTLNDKYIALRDVAAFLVKQDVIPLVLGGSQEFTVFLAEALEELKEPFRISVIDSMIDCSIEDNDFSATGYLQHVPKRCPKFLQDLTLVGLQKYLCAPTQEKFLTQYNYEFVRLGSVRDKEMKSVEPILRDSDLVSFDAGVVKGTDMPAQNSANPNGFLSHEACQLAWYAGASDRLKIFGLFEVNPEKDTCSQLGLYLCGQITWHFLQGVALRYNDYPKKKMEEYQSYIIHLEDYDVDIRFFRNCLNDRWWLEVAGGEDRMIVSCLREDYEQAANSDLPDKWLRYLKKSNCKSVNRDI